MTFKSIAVAALVALLGVAVASAAPGKSGGSLHAKLTGKAEVPKGDPDGAGTAEVKITGTSVCWELTTSRINAPNAAHIHKGAAGVAGPVVVPFGASYKAKGCAKTTVAVASAIKRSPASYYVNLHNAKYPAGVLRGQLSADDSMMG